MSCHQKNQWLITRYILRLSKHIIFQKKLFCKMATDGPPALVVKLRGYFELLHQCSVQLCLAKPSHTWSFQVLCGHSLFTNIKTRAATNVRTFEYYSFEIFTNELFLRTNVRWRPLVCFLAHTLRSEASAAASRVGAMREWRYSWNFAVTLVNVMSRRSQQRKKR